MKLVYCIHSLWGSGGTERIVTEKANYLTDVLGYEVTIVTSRQKGKEPFFKLSEKVRLIDLDANFYNPPKIGLYTSRLNKLLNSIKPDVCISLSNMELFVFPKLTDGSVKISEFHFSHDYLFNHLKNRSRAKSLTAKMERYQRKMSRMTVLTKQDQEIWKDKVPGVLQIYNFSSFPIGQAAKLQSRHAIAVGRLTRQKNFDALIRSWKTVNAKHPDWILDIYGEGPLKDHLSKLISTELPQGSVLLHKPCENIMEIMSEASIMLMTSLYEGFPLCLVEAVSLGLPLVSFDCPCGPSEIIEDGKNGYLVKTGDIDDFAQKTCRIIEDDTLRSSMGAASLEIAAKFSKDEIMGQWDSLFKSLPPREEFTRKDKLSALRINLLRLKMVIEAHVLNPLWRSSDIRREVRGKVIAKTVSNYIKKRYLQSANEVKPCQVVKQEKEKIFSIWFQGEEKAPELVKACFASIRKHCSEELVVLDEGNIFDWISLPQDIIRKFKDGKIKYCHFADICRVELLHEYGGFWIDATCFLTAPIPQEIKDQDFFVYMAGSKVHGNYSYIQNCFIRARKGAYLLEAWRAVILAYWIHEEKRIEYFQHQLMFKTLVKHNKTASEHFGKMPQIDQWPTHILWYRDGDKPYDAEQVKTISDKGFFFQKCTYRNNDSVIPGSFKQWIINSGQRRDSRLD